MTFIQIVPHVGNLFQADRVLQGFLRQHVPEDVLAGITPSLEEMGGLAATHLAELAQRFRKSEPELIPYDPWGKRIDQVLVSPAWLEFAKIAATHGVVATAYERKSGEYSRLHQFSLAYLFERSTHTYNCPLAMTDGACATLLAHGNKVLIDRAVPHLTSRDPKTMWTSGQWMTERTGGSDVGISETIAKHSSDGWRLFGTKWFTSATTSDVALTLARPEGNPDGGKGLALFYLEQRLPDGQLNGIKILRLKEKLGTRMLPTAELELNGTFAIPVAGLGDGVRNITPMLNITRTWNSVSAVAGLRYGLALAQNFANVRVAFGAPLSQKPLHLDTLASVAAELEAATHLTFTMVHLLGKEEAGTISDSERAALRLLHPLCKLWTAKVAVSGASEVLEAFGGAGYIEDTGLPQILRDAQVLSIWEGTTNVLSLDSFRAIQKEAALEPYLELISKKTEAVLPRLRVAAQAARDSANHAATWYQSTATLGAPFLEAGARRFALTLARSLALALLCNHATWAENHLHDPRPTVAALRFFSHGVDLVDDRLQNLNEISQLALG
ncbi:MAG: acyl-CoA dehydrogenase family protein [Myxococcales bacterium]|nr:acyl-CoA dehydrogenase family protein [Myxococcales bacterium]